MLGDYSEDRARRYEPAYGSVARVPDGGIQNANHPDAKSDDGLGIQRGMLDGSVGGRCGGGGRRLISQAHPIGIAIFVGIVGHRGPGQVHRVHRDDPRLKQARIRIRVLDLKEGISCKGRGNCCGIEMTALGAEKHLKCQLL